MQVATLRSPSSIRLWSILLAAGLLAGLGSWQVGEAFAGYFKPQLFKTAIQSLVVDAPSPESREAADVKNAHMAFTILGGILGLSMGLAGGAIRGNLKSALVATVLGLLLGTLIGLAASFVTVPIYYRFVDPLTSDLVVPVLVHGSIWGLIGATSGLAFAVGLNDRTKILGCILGGFIGGVLGAGIFEMIATATFPFDKTNQPVSITSLSRMTARFSVAISAAILIGLSTKITPRVRSRPSEIVPDPGNSSHPESGSE